MRSLIRSTAVLAVALTMAAQALAKPAPAFDASLLSHTFASIFGNHTAFSAKAQVNVRHNKSAYDMDMMYYMRDGKVRIDMDMGKMGGQIPPEALDRMKLLGMQHYVVVMHPGSNNHTTMLYPDLKAYVDVTPPQGDKKQGSTISARKKIGTEVVDGHKCDMYTMNVTRPDGTQSTITEWVATDLAKLPVKLSVTSGDAVATILYKDIDRKKPAASLFDVPKGYEQYPSMRALVVSQMTRVLGRLKDAMDSQANH